ncbi:MAG: amidohydrolase family protein [Chloroflexota bacterium]
MPMFQDLHVIDFHAHFPVRGDVSAVGGGVRHYAAGTPAAEQAAYMRAQSERYRSAWRMAWDFPEPEQEPEPGPDGGQAAADALADRWVGELDRYGIDRIAFATGGGNDTLARAVARHADRFIGFAHHNPFAPGATAEMQRAVAELGLRGLKILAPALERRIDDRDLYPLWQTVEALGLPVLIHFGMLGAGGGISWNERDNPGALESVARDFPTIQFVVPHFGIQYVKELLFLCWACENVHVDTSGSNQWTRWMPYPLTLDDLIRKFYETVGPDRILFGSDSSWFPRGFSIRYLQDQIRACRFMNLPDAALRQIFGGNAARLFRLERD